MRHLPQAQESLIEFGTLLAPTEAVEPILSAGERGALLEWLTEIWAKGELAKVGLKPRLRAIFDGPPGVGKTTLAHHLAARLGVRMLAVRPDRIIDCWVGSSGRNIGALFDLIEEEKEPVLLFFDEFDAIAGKRGRRDQAADDNRSEMVNTLLQRMDAHDGYLIAATNFGTQIDQAVWRRFDIHITLGLPGPAERVHILRRYLSPYQLSKGCLEALSEALETATPALMRQFAEGIKRQLIIGPKVGWDMARAAVIGRLVASISPHPDLGKPRLWSHGADDAAIRALPWPLSIDAPVEVLVGELGTESTVVKFRGAKP